MAVPEWRTGDNWPAITGTVTDSTGAAVNISTAVSIRFVAKLQSGPGTVITGATTNLDVNDIPTRGTWKYTWGASDLTAAGTYEVEIEVTWPSTKIETFPSSKTRAPTFVVSAAND